MPPTRAYAHIETRSFPVKNSPPVIPGKKLSRICLRSGWSEQTSTSLFGDQQHGGMCEFPFHGDRVETLADVFELPEGIFSCPGGRRVGIFFEPTP